MKPKFFRKTAGWMKVKGSNHALRQHAVIVYAHVLLYSWPTAYKNAVVKTILIAGNIGEMFCCCMKG